METTLQENNTQPKQKNVRLIKYTVNDSVQFVVNHLSQEEHVNGWQLVVPRRRQDLSVYLFQLPPYLYFIN